MSIVLLLCLLVLHAVGWRGCGGAGGGFGVIGSAGSPSTLLAVSCSTMVDIEKTEEFALFLGAVVATPQIPTGASSCNTMRVPKQMRSSAWR